MPVEGPVEILLARESCDAWLQETADSLEVAVVQLLECINNLGYVVSQLASQKRGSPDVVRHKMPVRYTLRPLENRRNLQAGLIRPEELRSRRK